MSTYYGIYEYNEHNVCVNPDIVTVDNHTWVKVAQRSEDEWVYGFWYYNGSSPCMRGVEVCESREHAIKCALKALLAALERSAKWNKMNDGGQSLSAALFASAKRTSAKLEEFSYKQLALF